MKSMKKLLAAVLAVAMLGACLLSGGCSVIGGLKNDSDKLAALDFDIFEYLVTGDGLSFALLVKDPEALGLEQPEATWGDFSAEADAQYYADMQAFSDRLAEIDRAALTEERDLLLYDTIAETLALELKGRDNYYFYEPLEEYSGAHSNLPLNMTFMPLDDVADVEYYLALLADLPRYMRQIAAFEVGKSAAGLFMTERALDAILEHIDTFTGAINDSFLISDFDTRAAEAEGMTAEALAGYSDRNKEIVTGDLYDSYRELYDTLESLRGTSRDDAGIQVQEGGSAYYEVGLEAACSMYLTPEKAYDLLYAEVNTQFKRYRTAASNDPSVYDLYDVLDITTGSVESDLDYLRDVVAAKYTELPEHTVTYMAVPPELEDQFSPAAYLIPAIDDATDNLLIINWGTLDEETTMLFTLAHEAYPGHMFQYIYQRQLDVGYTPKVLNLTAYYEGWSQHSEDFFGDNNDRFNNDYCNLYLAEGLILNCLMPAMYSIKVNYEGWEAGDILDSIQGFGLNYPDLAQTYYELAVDMPFYFMEYAMGYTLFNGVMRDYLEKDGATEEQFYIDYLDLGPTYFDVVRDRLELD